MMVVVVVVVVKEEEEVMIMVMIMMMFRDSGSPHYFTKSVLQKTFLPLSVIS